MRTDGVPAARNRPIRGDDRVSNRVVTVVSVLAYIVITLFTKRLLTWNLAMLYFVVTIDLLPRLVRRVRRGVAATTAGSVG